MVNLEKPHINDSSSVIIQVVIEFHHNLEIKLDSPGPITLQEVYETRQRGPCPGTTFGVRFLN